MAGGSGTRLWPLSRHNHPKQALKLIGDRTMFQYAVDRLDPLFPPENIYVVTAAEHVTILQSQVPELPIENFIVEPEGRGTAPAIGLAAIHIHERDPEAVMAVLTADHYIKNTNLFRHVLSAARNAAMQDYLVTLGIQPDSPSTGFGYIQQGDLQGEEEDQKYYVVEKFTEKPAYEVAEKMVESGQYSWNSGMFIWKIKQILGELERQMPDFYAQLMQVKEVLNTPQYNTEIQKIWPNVAKQTIDYGVMEGAQKVVVFPIKIGWTDIGDWSSLTKLLPCDQNGNMTTGQFIGIETSNTLVFGQKRLIATLGVENLVIIDTEDALLICPQNRAQDVRKIVDKLKSKDEDQSF
jgi:mannose-1-phosphate guanylyltransferase